MKWWVDVIRMFLHILSVYNDEIVNVSIWLFEYKWRMWIFIMGFVYTCQRWTMYPLICLHIISCTGIWVLSIHIHFINVNNFLNIIKYENNTFRAILFYACIKFCKIVFIYFLSVVRVINTSEVIYKIMSIVNKSLLLCGKYLVKLLSTSEFSN